MGAHTSADLRQMQSLPLEAKIMMTKRRIREWYEHWDGQVYVSFSGGKDSTVLLQIAREVYPDIEAVFVNTGLEYPEIQRFVKTFENVTILRPEMRFDDVLKTYGYPVISKEVAGTVGLARRTLESGSGRYTYSLKKLNGDVAVPGGFHDLRKWKPLLDADFYISERCCGVMKKGPLKRYERAARRHPITAQMAAESKLRYEHWLLNGCNAFDGKRPISNPISFWTEQDVLLYIKENNIPIASVYGEVTYANDPEQMRWSEYVSGFAEIGSTEQKALTTTGCKRTGCIFCMFGCHLEKEPNRFQRLKETHPRQYAYCIGGGEYGPDGLWKPNSAGLGLGHVLDAIGVKY